MDSGLDLRYDVITPAFLEALGPGSPGQAGRHGDIGDGTGQVLIPAVHRERTGNILSASFNGLADKIKSNDKFEHYISGSSIIDRTELLKLCQLYELEANLPLMELYLLAVVNSKLDGIGGLFDLKERLARKAISERVHQLLDWHPCLAHPMLTVYSSITRTNVSLMEHLVNCAVDFDVEKMLKLVAMASEPGLGFLKNLGLDGVQRENAVTAAAAKGVHGLRTLRALITTFNEPSALNRLVLSDLGKTGGMVAAGSEELLGVYMDTVKAINDVLDNAGMGDASRVRWTQSFEELDGIDTAWSDAKDRHPVLKMIYEAACTGTGSPINRSSDTQGFPQRPLEMVSGALNSLMQPECRLPLASLSNNQLLKLITLGAAAPRSELHDHFTKPSVRDGRIPRRSHGPEAMIDWFVARKQPGQPQITLDEVDFDRKRYVDLVGEEAFSKMRAKVSESAMHATIDKAVAPVMVLDAGEMPAPVRRSRAL
ncbi:hypothetical protein ABIC83_002803 [Roseateles asaccharophilus]|uniref:hypothetical protein n=1 Tax=Roseateles asaccharophilus TaxID=582607 RepID=UPI003836C83F